MDESQPNAPSGQQKNHGESEHPCRVPKRPTCEAFGRLPLVGGKNSSFLDISIIDSAFRWESESARRRPVRQKQNANRTATAPLLSARRPFLGP